MVTEAEKLIWLPVEMFMLVTSYGFLRFKFGDQPFAADTVIVFASTIYCERTSVATEKVSR